MTGEQHYNKTARDYYGEYSAHMYAWLLIGWADGKNMEELSVYAGQSKLAEVVVGVRDNRFPQNYFIGFVRFLGI